MFINKRKKEKKKKEEEEGVVERHNSSLDGAKLGGRRSEVGNIGRLI